MTNDIFKHNSGTGAMDIIIRPSVLVDYSHAGQSSRQSLAIFFGRCHAEFFLGLIRHKHPDACPGDETKTDEQARSWCKIAI